jgi:hypothetical protein
VGVTATYVVNNPPLFVLNQCHIKATTNNEILCASTPCYHIASRDGNNENKLAAATSYVSIKPLMPRRMSFISHFVLLFDDDNTRQCKQLAIMRKRTSFPLAIMRKRTSYPLAIVRKRTSY